MYGQLPNWIQARQHSLSKRIYQCSLYFKTFNNNEMSKLFLNRVVSAVLAFVLILYYPAHCKKAEELPKFYFTSKLEICPLDSPELYYEEVAFESLSTNIQESRVFFGVFLDNLESALSESDEYEKLQETWEDFTKTMSDNFDMKSNRINRMWDKAITTFETKVLPWEMYLRRPVLYEIFCGLHYEYLILEALVKQGAKELVQSLQGPFGKVIKKLGEVMSDENEVDPIPMMRKVEEKILELEPNFGGRLLSRMLTNGRKLKEDQDKGIVLIARTFLTDSVEQIGILAKAFRAKSQEYPNFWRQMAVIMRNGTSPKTGDELYMKYSHNEERFLVALLNLLSSPVAKA